VVDRYECEWANALKSPEKLKRFRHYVNDQRPDPAVVNIIERDQIRPASRGELITSDGGSLDEGTDSGISLATELTANLATEVRS
jgi:nitrite reductase (NADH) large subunit